MNRWFAAILALTVVFGVFPAKAAPLSQSDEKIYRQAFALVQSKKFDEAQAAAAKAKDPLLAKAVLWTALIAPGSNMGFGEVTSFMKANPTWPQPATLQRRAEESISAATPHDSIIAWFGEKKPVGVNGVIAYGKALIDDERQAEARPMVRDAWINGGFGSAQETSFLESFSSLLTADDHWARMKRLLWERNQDAQAGRQILRVTPQQRAIAQARMALRNQAPNAEKLVAALPPQSANDPGVIYEQLRRLRMADEDEKALKLLSHPAANQERPDLWWTERAILARRLLQKGQPARAYATARDHGQVSGAGYADAEWLAGWIALRFLNKGEDALRHFSRMSEKVKTPQSLSRALYWAGRAAEALGRAEEAQNWHRRSAHFVTTFYGQLSAAKLDKQHLWPLPSDPLPGAAEIQAFERHELVRAARMLAQIDQSDYVRPFMLRMMELAKTPAERAQAASLAAQLGRSDIAVAIAKKSEREGVPLIATGYPLPPHAIGRDPEKALVLGVIRQESAFNDRAISTAGARGLMQLMPATAERMAKTVGAGPTNKNLLLKALLDDPSLNISLGSAYLGKQIDDFNGSYIMAIAAYNAGPGRVRRWIQDYGDPRTAAIDPIDWIESIPYPETRNYTLRVLEGAQVYRRRLGNTGLALSLDADLLRGR